MTPSARVQAAIEVLDLVIAAARSGGAPADRLIADYFKTRRFAGSGDRRAVRDLVYAAIRAFGDVPVSGRAAMVALADTDPALAALFDGSRHGPGPRDPAEPRAVAGLAPPWLTAALADSGITAAEAAALLTRAPLDIRVNTLKTAREGLDLPLAGEPLPLPDALRFPHGTQVEQWDAYRHGLIEIQDFGSQAVCWAVGAQPGECVIDLCAGAGGKTLALAAAMDNRGRLIASDTDRGRLSRLGPRAERAGVTVAETRLLNPGHEAESLADLAADAVLVDAPCSGTGTWRRNPEARWRLTPRELERLTGLQARLLDLAAARVAPGGRLIYVVCSLLDCEGADQIDAFTARNPGWSAQPLNLAIGEARGGGIRLTPARDACDGFFVARLHRV